MHSPNILVIYERLDEFDLQGILDEQRRRMCRVPQLRNRSA